MSQPTTSEVLLLADRHVARYRGGLEQAMMGSRRWNADECKHYLDIWISIRNKGGEWSALSIDERSEIEDAIDSGELE